MIVWYPQYILPFDSNWPIPGRRILAQ